MSLQDSQRSSFYDEQDSTVFHLAIPVTDLAEAKEFYVSTLKCEIGRPVSYTHLTLPTIE